MANYTFLDATGVTQTAASSVIGGVNYPIVKIPDLLTVNPSSVFQAGTWNISSIIGTVTPYAQPDSLVYGVSSVITGTSATSVLAAPGGSLRNYITHIKVTNAASTGAIVDIKDSGGVVLDTGYAAASGGGWASAYVVPIKQPTANASVDVVPRSQASILATINGYKAL